MLNGSLSIAFVYSGNSSVMSLIAFEFGRHAAPGPLVTACVQIVGPWRGAIVLRHTVPAEVCESVRKRWRIGLPGACEPW